MQLLNSIYLTLGYLVLALGVTVIIILPLTYIYWNAERDVDLLFGPKFEIYAGFLEIMVHKASH